MFKYLKLLNLEESYDKIRCLQYLQVKFKDKTA